MSHSVEEYYRRCAVLHEKALELHRQRYKKSGEYDVTKCTFLIDDIKFKFHACCHGTHAALEALIYLRDKYKLKANLIDTIKIVTNPQYLKIMA